MQNWHEDHKEARTFGEKVADNVASFIGSWKFIIIQSFLLAVWAIFNILHITAVFHFDAYPFTFMNLFMSAEAAFATPLIMMAQNRQDKMHEKQAAADYQTNIDAKDEIEQLMRRLDTIETEKLDQIIILLKK